jgi:flagellar FliL protein
MAAAAAPKAEAESAEAAPAVPSRGKKKLVVIIAAVVLLLAVGGGGAAWYLMKKKAAEAAAAAAAEAEEGGDGEASAKADKDEPPMPKADLKHAPTFVPLDPFTVNLADRDAERYAQVGMTLELTDAKAGDLLKAYMPAIRNNILLVLAGKTAGELMEHEGKVKLATEVRAAALKPLGYAATPPAPHPPEGGKKDGHDDEPPVRAVHFSNFIIQ